MNLNFQKELNDVSFLNTFLQNEVPLLGLSGCRRGCTAKKTDVTYYITMYFCCTYYLRTFYVTYVCTLRLFL